jgi:hypothetical protein
MPVEINPQPTDSAQKHRESSLGGKKAAFWKGLSWELTRVRDQSIPDHSSLTLAHRTNRSLLPPTPVKLLWGQALVHTEQATSQCGAGLSDQRSVWGKRKLWIGPDFPGHVVNRNNVSAQEKQTWLSAILQGLRVACKGANSSGSEAVLA